MSEAPAPATPATLEEATALCARFAAIDAAKARIEARRQAQLARVNGAADTAIAAHEAEQAALVAAAEPWWRANAATLTQGKRKSIELAGCQIGSKTGRFAVTFAGGDDEAAVAALAKPKWGRDLLRVKSYLDRTAIGKALQGSGKRRLEALGFALIPGRDEFYIDRLGAAPIGKATRARA